MFLWRNMDSDPKWFPISPFHTEHCIAHICIIETFHVMVRSRWQAVKAMFKNISLRSQYAIMYEVDGLWLLSHGLIGQKNMQISKKNMQFSSYSH